MTPCPRRDDAATWVLGALDDAEARDFAAHLPGCERCIADVAALQPVVDVLPMAAPPMAPPPALKGRIMAVVESEAQLLRAAGPEADRPPLPAPRRIVGWRRLFGALRPLPAAALATALLAVGVLVGVLASGGSDTTVIRGFAPQGAQVALKVSDHKGHLEMTAMPRLPTGRTYQMWLVRGKGKPVSAGTFTVARDGSADVDVDGSLKDTDQLLVTQEPSGGSAQPTSAPLAGAKLT
jgi:anti-sigma-K factor RskA